MGRVLLFIFGLFVLTSFGVKKILIDETGFEDIRVGETIITKLKRKYFFAKRTKTFRHILYRTDEGRTGVTYYSEQIKAKGITFFFNYTYGTKEPIVLDEILFSFPSRVTTDKGIELGQSNFKQVEEKYGVGTTVFNGNRAKKEYGRIVFYSDKLVGPDAIDEKIIVKEIRIKRKP